MAGSFYMNCWTALGSFAIYFLLIFQTARTPVEILTQSFTVALIVFVMTFIVRFLIGYAFFTPQLEEVDTKEPMESIEQHEGKTVTIEKDSLQGTQAEEVAQVVQTLMAQEK